MNMRKPNKEHVVEEPLYKAASSYQMPPFQASLYRIGNSDSSLYQWYVQEGVYWTPWGELMYLEKGYKDGK